MINMEAMTILRITPWFLPAKSFGGPVTRIHEISKRLVEKGHEVKVYTTNMWTYRKKMKNFKNTEVIDGIEVKRFPVLFPLAGHYYITRSMIKELLRENCDIIHVSGYRDFQSDVGCLVSRLRHKPLVLSAYGGTPYYNLRDWIIKGAYDLFTLKYTLKKSDLLIAASDFEVNDYIRLGVDPNKIRLIRSGVNLKLFKKPKENPILKEYKLENKKVVLFLGRISPIKGIDFLVKSFKRVSKEIPNSVLLLVGEDLQGYKARIIKLIDQLDLSKKVIWIDNLDQKDIINAYYAGDVFVMSSKSESSPLVAYEAGACSLPIIATNVGGISEIFENRKNGLLVEYGNIKQLSDAIIELLENKELAHKLSKNFRRDVEEKYNWDVLSRQKESAYKELLQKMKT